MSQRIKTKTKTNSLRKKTLKSSAEVGGYPRVSYVTYRKSGDDKIETGPIPPHKPPTKK